MAAGVGSNRKVHLCIFAYNILFYFQKFFKLQIYSEYRLKAAVDDFGQKSNRNSVWNIKDKHHHPSLSAPSLPPIATPTLQ